MMMHMLGQGGGGVGGTFLSEPAAAPAVTATTRSRRADAIVAQHQPLEPSKPGEVGRQREIVARQIDGLQGGG